MAYRHTEKTLARKNAVKESLVAAALAIVAEGGFGALTVTAAAQGADMATGAVYKHFESKAALCAEVFRRATEKEVAMVGAAAAMPGTPTQRLRQAITTFAERALRGRRLAYALIAEPVDPSVDTERLRFRHAYAEIFQALIEDGVRDGTFAMQESSVSAAALVGLISEALVGPLTWRRDGKAIAAPEALIAAIQAFCLRAVGAAAP